MSLSAAIMLLTKNVVHVNNKALAAVAVRRVPRVTAAGPAERAAAVGHGFELVKAGVNPASSVKQRSCAGPGEDVNETQTIVKIVARQPPHLHRGSWRRRLCRRNGAVQHRARARRCA